jgi:hypothetical protein
MVELRIRDRLSRGPQRVRPAPCHRKQRPLRSTRQPQTRRRTATRVKTKGGCKDGTRFAWRMPRGPSTKAAARQSPRPNATSWLAASLPTQETHVGRSDPTAAVGTGGPRR